MLRAAVTALPPEHRAVVELRFFAGASLDEIASLLDCPLGTVKSRLHHGLAKLRQSIGGDATAPPGRGFHSGRLSKNSLLHVRDDVPGAQHP